MIAQVHTTDAASSVLTPDIWLSERLGMSAFTLRADADPEQRPVARPSFVQAKVNMDERDRLETLVRAGYALIETAVTLERNIEATSSPSPGRNIRFAVAADESAVRRIAGTVFRYSRFHMDPLISRPTADRIKADWAGNFFAGARGTHMVVADDGHDAVGFLQLIHRGDVLIIDLVGVAPESQGRGLGRQMLDFAAGEIDGPRRYVVGTQLHNFPSLAYYTSYGFRILRSNHTLHRHFR
jgi:ribosomal protein S18 acetylase RimI-like enzyme